jgi:hypothetical protein
MQTECHRQSSRGQSFVTGKHINAFCVASWDLEANSLSRRSILLIPDITQPKAFRLIYKNDSAGNVATACQTGLQTPCAVGPLLIAFDFPFLQVSQRLDRGIPTMPLSLFEM